MLWNLIKATPVDRYSNFLSSGKGIDVRKNHFENAKLEIEPEYEVHLDRELQGESSQTESRTW